MFAQQSPMYLSGASMPIYSTNGLYDDGLSYSNGFRTRNSGWGKLFGKRNSWGNFTDSFRPRHMQATMQAAPIYATSDWSTIGTTSLPAASLNAYPAYSTGYSYGGAAYALPLAEKRRNWSLFGRRRSRNNLTYATAAYPSYSYPAFTASAYPTYSASAYPTYSASSYPTYTTSAYPSYTTSASTFGTNAWIPTTRARSNSWGRLFGRRNSWDRTFRTRSNSWGKLFGKRNSWGNLTDSLLPRHMQATKQSAPIYATSDWTTLGATNWGTTMDWSTTNWDSSLWATQSLEETKIADDKNKASDESEQKDAEKPQEEESCEAKDAQCDSQEDDEKKLKDLQEKLRKNEATLEGLETMYHYPQAITASEYNWALPQQQYFGASQFEYAPKMMTVQSHSTMSDFGSSVGYF